MKLDYIPQDNSVIVQITDPTGFDIVSGRYVPIDNDGIFQLYFWGKPSIPLHGGIYEIKRKTGVTKKIPIPSKFDNIYSIISN